MRLVIAHGRDGWCGQRVAAAAAVVVWLCIRWLVWKRSRLYVDTFGRNCWEVIGGLWLFGANWNGRQRPNRHDHDHVVAVFGDGDGSLWSGVWRQFVFTQQQQQQQKHQRNSRLESGQTLIQLLANVMQELPGSMFFV